MLGIQTLSRKILGSANDRKVRSVRPLVAKINALEPEFSKMSDEEIVARTRELQKRVQEEEASLDSILPEAFANCREAARRALGLRAFDVQLMGGIFLHQGNIAEMRTGEGKTLVAVFPSYLNALTGKGVHVVTVNDYLAKRDAEWMGKVHKALGLSVGVVYPFQTDEEKRAAYQADVTYGTNNELGFDYLRDNMKGSIESMMQRGHNYAIIDEVDSILIDEARTPLIISGPSSDQGELYALVDKVIPLLDEDSCTIDEKQRNVTFTEEGTDQIERLLHEAGILPEGQALYDVESTTIVHHVNQALRAHKLYHKDQQYIVRDDQVMLIDEFTGRMMKGRRLSDGLHQAIEAKEGVTVQPENVTLASVTFQNYFRLYDKLSGMTGTAATEKEEFMQIYGLGVVVIPTNRPVQRKDDHDQVYRTEAEKFRGIIASIKEAHEKGQPILVGTTSIEKSEELSRLLDEAGISHNVLNARQHEQEAGIVASAGRLGAVTIATNMAGRGTDIQLGGNVEMRVLKELTANPESDPDEVRRRIEAETAEEKQKVLAAGGLYVLGTERHESRRVDNQLRGRSGRQGDPGRSCFFLSLQDDLMRIFGSDRLDKVLTTLGLEEGEAIIHPWVNKSIEKAQAKVEARNFDIRKQLLKFDDVMNDQRKAIFSQRLEILQADHVAEVAEDMLHQTIDDMVDEFLPPKTYPESWNTAGLQQALDERLGLEIPVEEWAAREGVDQAALADLVIEEVDRMMDEKTAAFGIDTMRSIEKQILLQAIDSKWREHLQQLGQLRSVIGFRSYAQKDPLNEYKTEAFQLFENMLERLRLQVSEQLSLVRPLTEEERAQMMAQVIAAQQAQAAMAQAAQEPDAAAPAPALVAAGADESPASLAAFDEADPATWGNPGRNDPCPCGSGKKFKHCHGQIT